MVFMSCVCHAFTSEYCCVVVTCWERTDLLALVCDVLFCFNSHNLKKKFSYLGTENLLSFCDLLTALYHSELYICISS